MTNVIGKGDATGTARTVVGTKGAIWAYSVQVRNAAQTSAPSSGTGSLSGGAIAGIVVGAVLAIVFAGIGAVILMRRRKHHIVPSSEPLEQPKVNQGWSGYPSNPAPGERVLRHELPGEGFPAELPTSPGLVEVPVYTPMVEPPGPTPTATDLRRTLR